jgi:hypothetical protein
MTMDLVSSTVGLPFAPIKLVLAIARLLQEEAESHLYDPARVRRELEEIEEAQAHDELPDDVAEEHKKHVVSRLTRGR